MSHVHRFVAHSFWTYDQERGTLKGAVDSLTATLHQQETHHLSAADAQQRQLHAFNMALLEQAEELAALQALLGAPSRKRQSIRRRVTEDLMDSTGALQVRIILPLLNSTTASIGVGALVSVMLDKPAHSSVHPGQHSNERHSDCITPEGNIILFTYYVFQQIGAHPTRQSKDFANKAGPGTDDEQLQPKSLTRESQADNSSVTATKVGTSFCLYALSQQSTANSRACDLAAHSRTHRYNAFQLVMS